MDHQAKTAVRNKCFHYDMLNSRMQYISEENLKYTAFILDTNNNISRFLVVISQCLQENKTTFFILFFLTVATALFGSANNCAFKGCTHLRAPSWPVTWRPGELCTHFTPCSWPAHSINRKTANNKKRKLPFRGKSEERAVAKFI